MEVLITFHVKVFLGNKYNSYIHTAPNAELTRSVYPEIYLLEMFVKKL